MLVVQGMPELQRALRKADRDVRLGIRRELRGVVEPVRVDVESLAASQIRNLDEGDPWSKMRTGVSSKLVYVAPRKRGKKTGRQKRPNLARLIYTRAMEPAVRRGEPVVKQRFERMLDTMADNFNRKI